MIKKVKHMRLSCVCVHNAYILATFATTSHSIACHIYSFINPIYWSKHTYIHKYITPRRYWPFWDDQGSCLCLAILSTWNNIVDKKASLLRIKRTTIFDYSHTYIYTWWRDMYYTNTNIHSAIWLFIWGKDTKLKWDIAQLSVQQWSPEYSTIMLSSRLKLIYNKFSISALQISYCFIFNFNKNNSQKISEI